MKTSGNRAEYGVTDEEFRFMGHEKKKAMWVKFHHVISMLQSFFSGLSFIVLSGAVPSVLHTIFT